MSAVLLRCDNCGTSQSARGLCEACHEGQVRYFCTNHNPGRWLETKKCPQCGAEYGVTLTISPATKRPETGDLRSRSKKSAPPIDGPAHATRPGRRTGAPWGSRPPRAPEGILVSDEAAARARALERLRRLLGAARYGRRAPDPTDLTYGSPMPMMAGGCLRAVLLVMLFFLLVTFLGLANFGILIRGY
jgi:hypothetical protein